MKSLFLAMICSIWQSIQCHSVAAENELQNAGSTDNVILVDNPVSAERTALNEVENAVRQNPGQAPDIVTKALRIEVPHPVPVSCEIVRAAIAGFGRQITRVGVARMVYAAVQAMPNETLSIVGVAIEDTLPGLHQDVVGAAIAACPNPYDCVSPTSLQSPACKAIVPTPIRPEPCDGTPLAEAIVQQALLSGAAENEFALDPDPGIGDLAHDALINKLPVLSQTPPPTPPPVSP